MGFMGGVFGSKRKDWFAETALGLVRAHDQVEVAELDRKEFQIRHRSRDGQTGVWNLESIYRRTENLHDGDVFDQLADSVADTFGPRAAKGSWEEVAPRLRPLIRQPTGLADRAQGMLLAEHQLWRPLLPCLIEVVVVDRPTSMERVHPGELERWGVDAETVFATARANLTRYAQQVLDSYDPVAHRGGFYIPDADGDRYAGALPLVDGWLAAIGAKAGKQPIVLIGGNVGILIGADASPEHVRALAESGRQIYDQAVRAVSPMPYTVDDTGQLTALTVARTHPAWPAIRSAEATLWSAAYGDQHAGLRADLDSGIIENYAATLMHVRGPDGVETTLAPWTDTVPTLLPRAHNVSLTDPETGDTFAVPWETLTATVDLIPVPDLFPVRYFAENHPAPEVTDHLRAVQGMV